MSAPPPAPFGAGGYGQPPGPAAGPPGPAPGPGFGAPGPYGGWPPPPPPRRRGLGGGAITAIVLGSLAAAGVLLFALVSLVRAAQPHGTEKIVFPATLESGRYHRVVGDARVEAQERALQGKLPDDGTAKVATYTAGASDRPTGSGLAVAGAYGDIDTPSSRMRADMLDGLRQSQAGEVIGERREFAPGAGDEEVSCQLTRISRNGVSLYAPACAWADSSTAATVLDLDIAHTSPDSVDLAEFARVTVRIKDQVTVPR
ncbi:hypothetical protein [Streptomyces qinglanensis]|uniref:hypothetical protein n=1 Tax=Streptomyces qinglanensis TaxID=943816 RepID=UPI003D715DF7